MTSPTTEILSALTIPRIRELYRAVGVVPRARKKEAVIAEVAHSKRLSLHQILQQMRRDELRRACRDKELDDGDRSRQVLMKRLLEAHGDPEAEPPPPLFTGEAPERLVPEGGDTVVCRHRKWLVEEVLAPVNEGDATRVALVCLDDDNRGATLEVLWELELGARLLAEDGDFLASADHLDPPQHFGAYLNTLRWQGVSAADKSLFQAPFRAGIEVLAHQLTPLAKALELPRANLFIADDVGLGKTIEAGLILQELKLRQRVDFALIVCPASVTLQWQAEMEQRFGLRFEIYSRDFVLARRRERGFGVNAWATSPRFIISYPLLRRPEYREPLLAHLQLLSKGSTRAKKSLLILDEAHTAAPASASRYAIDSQTTHVVRDVARQFENRLFLSATPHNGHSNSFSALLEILDPQRFTRGVPVQGRDELAPVMVRRLKSDLRQLTHAMRFPERKVVRIGIKAEQDSWSIDLGEKLGAFEAPMANTSKDELELATLLSQYTELFAEQPRSAKLPLINLQKRLLSSVEAFHRTLEVHAKAKDRKVAAIEAAAEDSEAELTEGLSEEAADAALDAIDAQRSADLLRTMPAGAEDLLAAMREKARALRRAPGAKARALVLWIQQHLCAGASFEASKSKAPKGLGEWDNRRILIFTEYTDTRRYLRDLLREAIADTDQGEERILELHGGMSEEARSEVQFAFNGAPAKHPVRILLATDAAREGLNLQAQCADLFHYDIPWNPSRMEQRNGRIDRALQPSPEVRCHYFVYEDRHEDAVLEKLVKKTEVIRQELGSLGEVVRERITEALDAGITPASSEQLDLVETNADEGAAKEELESSRHKEDLQRELDTALRIYSKSQKALNFRSEQLRDTVNVGLSISGHDALEKDRDEARYTIPEMSIDWERTLDPLRPPRGRDEPFLEWRRKAPRPVVFDPPKVLSEDVVHLHLEHPFVQRLLSRFVAQGFGAHDLSRISAVAVPKSGDTVALALGRLCLFGRGAGLLHDGLLCAAARVTGRGPSATTEVLSHQESEAALSTLEAQIEGGADLSSFAAPLQAELLQLAQATTPPLMTALRAEADSRAIELEQMLGTRAEEEKRALQRILENQRDAIQKTLGGTQLQFDFGDSASEAEQAAQVERDKVHLRRRLDAIEHEIEHEPGELAALYDVVLRRFEPVGLVILYPELLL